MWKGKERGMVRWEVLMMKQEEGGVGLREPLSALDAAKMRMLGNLMTKDRQPWMKWVERKLRRVAERWGVAEAAKPSKKQVKELKEDCVVEDTLRIWFEIGGRGGVAVKEKRKKKEEEIEVELSGLGIDNVDGDWIPIERMKMRKAYDKLIQKRMKMKNYTPKEAHRNIHAIQKTMTAVERDYWWRLTHRTIQTKKRESKWKKDERGEEIKSTCPVCKAEEEDWDHYDYECQGVREMNAKVAERAGREQAFSKEEWRLEKEGMERKEMMIVAKARWIYHCERVKMDKKKRKRMNTTTLMNRLNRRMKIVAEQNS